MGRAKRADEAGAIDQVRDRSNRCESIFDKPADYEAFERILGETLERVPLRLYSYCVMPNHWHLMASPTEAGQMSRLGQWLGDHPHSA